LPHLSLVFSLSLPPLPTSTLFPYTTLFRSSRSVVDCALVTGRRHHAGVMLETLRAVLSACRDYASEQTHCDDAATGRTRVCAIRSEEHTSELQSRGHLVCRLLLEKKKNNMK